MWWRRRDALHFLALFPCLNNGAMMICNRIIPVHHSRMYLTQSTPIIRGYRRFFTAGNDAHKRGRGRRDALHSLQAASSNVEPTKITQYTINDSICPPTDSETLNKIVKKHIHTLPRYWKSRPIADHTSEAFREALNFVLRRQSSEDDVRIKVILDSGCGTGKSSFILGEMYKDCVVIGVDQSLSRLSRNKEYNGNTDDSTNVLLLRAELSDFWKCCLSSSEWQQSVHIQRHYLLYPNPYPKKSRLKNRFYAHPAFPLLMMTSFMNDNGTNGEKLIVRSNWEGYLQEFKAAVDVWRETGGTLNDFRTLISDGNDDEWRPIQSINNLEVVGPNQLGNVVTPLTNFEAKFIHCGEPIYELSIEKTIKFDS